MKSNLYIKEALVENRFRGNGLYILDAPGKIIHSLLGDG